MTEISLAVCQGLFHRLNAKTPMKWEVISLFMGVAVQNLGYYNR